jgi:Ca2+-dependent lipid-binding protein
VPGMGGGGSGGGGGGSSSGSALGASRGGTVSVRVVRATGLLAADRGGTSDPYVVVQSAGGKKAKTSVKKRTLDPEWDEMLELSVYDASAPLSFAVWDHDKVCTPKPSLCGPNPRPNPGPKLKLNHDKARAP